MFEDPVKRAERELVELERLHRAELGIPEESEESGADTQTVEPDEPAYQTETETVEVEEKAPQPEDQKPDDEETWKQRFATMQGKYEAEVPRLAEELRNLRQTNQDLIRQLTELATQKADGQTKSSTAEEAITDLALEYGADFTRAIDKRASVAAQEIVDRMMEKMDGRFQRVEQEVATSASGRFFTQLEVLSPGCAEQNDDPAFINWATTNRDPMSGSLYSDLALSAFNAGNVQRAALIFNLYKMEQDRVVQPQTGSTTTTKPTKTTPSPAHLMVPGSRTTASGSQQIAENAQGKVWTMAEIDHFYKQIELGKINAKDARSTEAEILRASAEGRVIG